MNKIFNYNSILVAENGQNYLLKNEIEIYEKFLKSFLKDRQLVILFSKNTIDSILLYVSQYFNKVKRITKFVFLSTEKIM